MTDYGTDVTTIPDLDATFTLQTGPIVVAWAVLRRWTTPRGLLDYDPTSGFDVRQYLNAKFTNTSLQLYQVRRNMEAEAEKDERVFRCDVVITLANQVMSIAATIYLADGPFVLTASVSTLTVQLLTVTP